MMDQQEGGYVLNIKDAAWKGHDRFGRSANLERGERFSDVGIHLFMLTPGNPNCRYHRESAQENFLVLSGSCKLLMNDTERQLAVWDFVHCPPGVSHVLVGTGDSPAVVLAIGHRQGAEHELYYPASELAAKYGAQAPEPTPDPRVAYGDVEPATPIDCPQEWPPR